MRIRIISRFRFTFIFRNAGGSLPALFAKSKITSCILKFILIVTLFEIRHCESFHHFVPRYSRFSIKSAKYRKQDVNEKEREKEILRWWSPYRAFAFFDRLKDRRYVLTEGSAEGRNVFLGPGYPHKDSRLPTYSDCMRHAVRCSPMQRHGGTFALSRRPQTRKWRYPPCLHTRVGRPAEANVS